MQKGVNCITKYRFYKYPVKVGHFFVQKPLVFMQNGVNCIKKFRFHMYPVKVGQHLCKIHWFVTSEMVISRVEGREPTNKHSDTPTH